MKTSSGWVSVRTVGDFRVRGEPPTHPDLLEWLAHEFAADRGRLGLPEPGERESETAGFRRAGQYAGRQGPAVERERGV